ncbi:phosphatase PAP2 family protein [Ramlibacter sp. AW1]|uniref:Phosphatase PAP2 family protein n=1 Tax=Ramlibacter aurantiacus TaxID=2801330 RepID=A0A937D2X8_9BURK|nr:phosphatase PAP2 family protein [Ramlibacter aurantiacus]MBL0420170.1 phosphatase PAP2 family protein [Ramlibacter aurantiacus]
MSVIDPLAAHMRRRGVLAVVGAALLPHARSDAGATPIRQTTPHAWFAPVSPQGPARSHVPAGASDPEQVRAARRLRAWTRAVQQLVVKYQQNPLRAARAWAYVQVALHDAWVAAAHATGGDAAQAEGAAQRAASGVLAQLYPTEAEGRFEAAYAALASGRTAAAENGRSVAQALVARSLGDGSGRVWPPNRRPAEFAGAWQPAWPLYAANPAEGLAGEWRPWVAPAAARYAPPPPPRPGTETHRRETLEVLEVRTRLTAEQVRLAHAWHLDAGSVTPPGVWMDLALQELDAAAPFTMLQVLAGTAVALHDALVACWRVKMREWSERPITAIRRELDPAFEPLLVTPGFPGYVSGHACASAAAAQVLAFFLPQRAAWFHARAREAAESRLWGGIHFRCDNEEGLRLGQAVGQEVVGRM